MDKPVTRPVVVIGMLGTTLDTGRGPARWRTWRPSVALCQHPTFPIHRFELLHSAPHAGLARDVAADIAEQGTDVRLREIPDVNPWDFERVFEILHAFAHDYPFDPEHEDYLVHITTGSHVAQICLFLLTEARHIPARLVQTGPGEKRGVGPGTVQVIDLDLSRYDRLARRFERETDDATSFLKSGIATRNAAFNALIDRIERVALATTAPILLTGETGTGKSSLARRIHALKANRRLVRGPLVEVNCATLRGDGAMSALFGHRRGAFTGSVSDRAGLLKRANQGVLFLDEVGELGLDEQAMLLHAIEEHRFLPVGADHEDESDFQLIAGSNRDLAARVRAGAFREDLLARLDLWTFHLPPLRERREDIEPNLDFELARFERTHGRRVSFNREARERFLAFALAPGARWSANFRDLGAAVARMATLASGGRIGTAEVDEESRRLGRAWQDGEPASSRVADLLGERAGSLDRFERVQLEDVLGVCGASASLSEAGRVLFAQSRARRSSVNDADRLRKFLARFDLDWDAVRRA